MTATIPLSGLAPVTTDRLTTAVFSRWWAGLTYHPHIRWGDRMHRTLAAFCAALVFVLGLFAASPGLHHQLHHNGGGGANDVCAITLFANGVSAPAIVNAAPPPPTAWQCIRISPAADVFVESPHYRFQPERGPPTV